MLLFRFQDLANWVLHRTSPDGRSVRIQVASATKYGFETALQCEGYAKHVVVDAIDNAGQILGQSGVISTVPDKTVPVEEIVKADQWLSRIEGERAHSGLSKHVGMFIVGALCGSTLLLLCSSIRHSRLRGLRWLFCWTQKYRPTQQEETHDAELLYRGGVPQEVNASDHTREQAGC